MRRKLLLLTLAVVAFGFNTMFAGSGGPDAYGYTWMDSDEAGGPTFGWIDITTMGTEVTGLADDNSATPLDMGFEFAYYWENYSDIKLGSNGWISFETGVDNIAHCFPTIPSPGGAGDNLICPFMTDLNFAGSTNPGQMFWWSNNVDTFIVSYINVPWWSGTVANEFDGSNTFQVILSAVDSSITFQYQTMDPAVFNNTAFCDVDLTIGIENMTGNIGLAHSLEVVPPDNHKVVFSPPVEPLITIADATPDWLANTANAGQFYFTGTDIGLITKVKNVGNGDLSTATVATASVDNLSFTEVYTASTTIDPLAAGENDIVTFSPAWSLTDAGQYYFEVETASADDFNPSNNTKVVEISAVTKDTVGCSTSLSYSTGNPPDGVISWSGGSTEDGAGIEIVPPGYPVTVNSIDAFIVAGTVDPVNSGTFWLRILDDDGPGGTAGTVLFEQEFPQGTYVSNDWVSAAVSPGITITDGAYYAAWFMGNDSAVALGTETLGPISRRGYEILSGSWAKYRSGTLEDFLIRTNIDACSVGIEDDLEKMDMNLTAFPNPASELTTLRYTLRESGKVNFTVINMNGQVVHRKVYGPLSAGTQEINFDTYNLSTGTYILNMETASGIGTRKLEVVR